MAHSIGLTLYNLAAPRRDHADGAAPVQRPARPGGRLAWLHAPNADAARTMVELARRLMAEDGLAVLLTCPQPPGARGVIWQLPPDETPAEARAFLDHWRPEIGVMSEGELRPALLHEAQDAGVPLILLDGRAPYLLRERDGWYPGLMRSTLSQFHMVQALDEPAARAFRRAGAKAETTGRMEEPSAALPCTEAERAALTRLLASRPVWLAASLPEDEETAVLEAHRAALRMAHRLLLIVVPQDPARALALSARMEAEEGWVVARRAADQEPDAETTVYIADTTAEFGLWYRLAPITFLGGSLNAQGCLRSPMEPAALGSAIIHGPRVGAFGGLFGRLGAARAVRPVASPGDLSEALSDLLSPDRAARLAQAAWGVTSAGAEATQRALALIRHLMDGRA
ncbi:glycosyltransferase N-terminal domain-containing protein [Paracoccaceae bacterium Fryx2]|nr:glycosyltransferase N-terminal domain-containing protein [Paracoccaceae bacterium Fryx2]